MSFACVIPHLYIGSAPAKQLTLRKLFRAVVLCAEEYQPRDPWQGVEVLHAGIDDGDLSERERHKVVLASIWTAQRIRAGKNVLVTCWQGRNRSGLVVAATLRRLGYPPDRAIAMVRVARGSSALRNGNFTRAIRARRV